MVSTFIAVVGLIGSGVALYFSALRPARPLCRLGTTLKVYYPSDGGFGMYLPLTFVNDSPQTATVRRCALSLFSIDSDDQRFFMDWRYFMKLKEDGQSFDFVSWAGTIGIPGHAAEERVIWFTWRQHQEPALIVHQGAYVLQVHNWLGASDQPHTIVHRFTVNSEAARVLEDNRINGRSGVVDLLLDDNLPVNMLMKADQAKQLLGA